jgi:hypothetical protein
MYQFDPMLFSNPDHEFDIDDAEAKLFVLMKSAHAVDGCKLVRHRVDKAITCNRKRSLTFICSHGKVMMNINETHFGPDSVGRSTLLIRMPNGQSQKDLSKVNSSFVKSI